MNVHLPLPHILKNKRVYIYSALAVLVTAVLLVTAVPDLVALTTSEVERGDFVVSITARGEIRATNSFTLPTRRTWHGNIQIVYLIPDGTTARAGRKSIGTSLIRCLG